MQVQHTMQQHVKKITNINPIRASLIVLSAFTIDIEVVVVSDGEITRTLI